MKLTPGVNFINVKRTNFLYKRSFGSFYYVHVTRKKLSKQHSYEKFVRLTLMKLTTAEPEKIIGLEICAKKIPESLRTYHPNWATTKRFHHISRLECSNKKELELTLGKWGWLGICSKIQSINSPSWKGKGPSINDVIYVIKVTIKVL